MKSTPVNEKVDYLMIKYKMLEMLKSIKASNDFCFDWTSIKSISPEKTGQKRVISPRKIKKEQENQEDQKQIQNQIY